jgi:hypothetical protein
MSDHKFRVGEILQMSYSMFQSNLNSRMELHFKNKSLILLDVSLELYGLAQLVCLFP